jgi:hypothetical protein
VQNVPVLQNVLGGKLTMNPEIFSILATAIERSMSKDKHPQNRGKSSVPEQKILENLCQSSEYREYAKDNLINEVALLMNNDKDFVYAEIAKLNTLDIKELRKLWKDKTNCDAPHYWNKTTFVEELANLLQKLAFGDLSQADADCLNEYKNRLRKGLPLFDPCKKLPEGMVLTKDYNGYRHVVRIMENEKVEYDGAVYKSLSAVARQITGVRWNGREFFHVTGR